MLLPFWQKLLCVALAGAAGTVARYGLVAGVQRVVDDTFPWGTLLVNGAGCFLFGFAVSWLGGLAGASPQLRLLILTGFMGAFTTFSTFAFETAELARQSQWWAAIGNLVAQNTVGLALAVTGLAVGRAVWLVPATS
jgi:CrcB protein